MIMKRPDFTLVKHLMDDLSDLNVAFAGIFEEAERIEESVRAAAEAWLMQAAKESLAGISVDELSVTLRRAQIQGLKDGGYNTLRDLEQVPDACLLAVAGVGDKSVAAIRNVQTEFLRVLSEREHIVLNAEAADDLTRGLIINLCRFLKVDPIRKEAGEIREQLSAEINHHLERVKIRNRLQWFLSRRSTKEDTILAIGSLIAFIQSPLYKRALHFISAFHEAAKTEDTPDDAWDSAKEDFRKNSPAYYAALEKLSLSGVSEDLLYQSIPARLASEIREEPLDTSTFRGNLRSYQDFGVRYILHQKKVLLGDEMGLGKTIQAIAAMTHLFNEDQTRHFLIVCPASVMLNWCREVVRFSDIRVFLVHGEGRETAFSNWKQQGGAAVTSYEGMSRITKQINKVMTLALFVIDEAHYIKNPEAQRTKNIRRLYEESERILLMTGTPLENRVDEMCELIGFVRPDLVSGIREKAHLRNLPEFKKDLAPVYLRRLREQVLPELPPMTEEEEWCSMTAEDRAAYIEQVEKQQFMAMRRVSFLQEELAFSAKACRLKELCEAACDEGRKVVVYSYFLETIRKAAQIIPGAVLGTITGSIPVAERQRIIDQFTDAPGGAVLICQIQAGGTGLNLQAASVVVFCEPQIKPSLTKQALSRVYRMGQVQNVLVCHLLCENTVDEAVRELTAGKQAEFDLFAEESALAEAAEFTPDREWIRNLIEKERQKYLPALVGPVGQGDVSH